MKNNFNYTIGSRTFTKEELIALGKEQYLKTHKKPNRVPSIIIMILSGLASIALIIASFIVAFALFFFAIVPILLFVTGLVFFLSSFPHVSDDEFLSLGEQYILSLYK